MKNLNNFVLEYKTRKWPEDAEAIHNDPEIKNAIDADKLNDKKMNKPIGKSKVSKGTSANNNGTEGRWDVDSPDPNWAEELAKSSLDDFTKNNNLYWLNVRLKRKSDFFVQGEAGWAKTAIIKEYAKKFGYTILTVYLDKAIASDLGGIPVVQKTKVGGYTYMDYSVPGWALYMIQHPNEQFLLFFDELNQASPDVLNALMPIVLEHVICGIRFKNFFVGAAGNFEYENNSLSELNGPLIDRFKPIITWESHTKGAWDVTFEYFHERYDKTLGPEIIEKFKKFEDIWSSPRDLTRVIFEYIKDMIGSRLKFNKPEYIRTQLIESCLRKNENGEKVKLSRSESEELDKLAEYISQFIANDGKPEESKEEKRRTRGRDQIRIEDKEALLDSLKKGYYLYSLATGGDGKRYVCTLENVISGEHGVFNPEATGITKEVLDHLLKQFEAEGNKVKYKTLKDAEKDMGPKNLLLP